MFSGTFGDFDVLVLAVGGLRTAVFLKFDWCALSAKKCSDTYTYKLVWMNVAHAVQSHTENFLCAPMAEPSLTYSGESQ